jgi:hypothetical protein
MSILCLLVNCLTIDRHYWNSWHVATRHWHSYRQPPKCQLINQCQSLLTFYWHISYNDKIWHVRHSKMSLSIACWCKMSQLCHDRWHVADMLATYPAKIILFFLITSVQVFLLLCSYISAIFDTQQLMATLAKQKKYVLLVIFWGVWLTLSI